jgi:hypothetical protein
VEHHTTSLLEVAQDLLDELDQPKPLIAWYFCSHLEFD